jgi:hypothetical protein
MVSVLHRYPALAVTPLELRQVVKQQRAVIKNQDQQLQTFSLLGYGEIGASTLLHAMLAHANGRQCVETVCSEQNFYNVPDEFERKKLTSMVAVRYSKSCPACAFANSRVDPHEETATSYKFELVDALSLRVSLSPEAMTFFEKSVTGKIRPFQIMVADASTGNTPSRRGNVGKWTARCIVTGYPFVFPYKTRTQMYGDVKVMSKVVELRYGLTIKMLRLDRIGEQAGKKMKQVCGDIGIIVDLGAPQTSKDMAKAENLNLLCDRGIRVMLAGCQVPKAEWDYAAEEWARVKSFLGIRKRGWRTPMALVTNRPRDFVKATLVPFGAVMAAKIKVPSQGKEKMKMTMGLFVGRERMALNESASVLMYRPAGFRAAGSQVVRPVSITKVRFFPRIFDPYVMMAVMRGCGRDVLHDMYKLGDTSREQYVNLTAEIELEEEMDGGGKMKAYSGEMKVAHEFMQSLDEEVEKDQREADTMMLDDDGALEVDDEVVEPAGVARQRDEEKQEDQRPMELRKSQRVSSKTQPSRSAPGGDFRRYTSGGGLTKQEEKRREGLAATDRADAGQSDESEEEDRDTDGMETVGVDLPTEALHAQVAAVLDRADQFAEVWQELQLMDTDADAPLGKTTITALAMSMEQKILEVRGLVAQHEGPEEEAALDFDNTPRCFDECLMRLDWREWVEAYRLERGNLEPTVIQRQMWQAQQQHAKVHGNVTVTVDKQNADTGEREKRKVRGSFNGKNLAKSLSVAQVFAGGISTTALKFFCALMTKKPPSQVLFGIDYKAAFLQTKDGKEIKEAPSMFMHVFEWWDRCMCDWGVLAREREKLLADRARGMEPDPKQQYKYPSRPDAAIFELQAFVYGHPRAGQVWTRQHSAAMIKRGWDQTKKEPAWFHLRSTGAKEELSSGGDKKVQRPNDWPGQAEGRGSGDAVTYVDDMLATFENPAAKERFLANNEEDFEFTENEGKAMIGFRLTREQVEMNGKMMMRFTMDGEVFVRKLMTKYGMLITGMRKVATPALEGVMRTSLDACDLDDVEMVKMCTAFPFRSIVCALMWLRTVRPDIDWAVWHLTLHLHDYGPKMIDDCKRVLRYLELNPSDALCYVGDGNPGVIDAIGGHDASIQSVHDDRSSVVGVMVMVQNAPVVVLVQKLKHKALSSAEGELKGMTAAYCLVRSLQQLSEEIEVKMTRPVPLEGDCKPAKNAAECPGANRSKMVHIDTSAFLVRDGITEGDVQPVWVPGTECVADILTKALGPTLFLKFKKILMGGATLLELRAFAAVAKVRLDSAMSGALRSEDAPVRVLVARLKMALAE